MQAYLGPLMAGFAFMLGWTAYGWPGLLLAGGVVVFWLLLQYSRALRLMQRAGSRPLGLVDSAVMLQARMAHGLNMQEVIALAGSLGQKVAEPDDWRWHDNAGNEVVVAFRRGRVVRWYFGRGEVAAQAGPDAPPEPGASIDAGS